MAATETARRPAPSLATGTGRGPAVAEPRRLARQRSHTALAFRPNRRLRANLLPSGDDATLVTSSPRLLPLITQPF